MPRRKQTFFYRNGLSFVVLLLMLLFWGAQSFTGWKEKNRSLIEQGKSQISFSSYFSSGHFLSATFENWESEFLQMGIYVLLTISLRQKGSSESKPLEGKEEVDREPNPHPKAPWPVRKGGIWLRIYQNSLSLVFIILFSICFLLHFYGSLKDENEELLSKGKTPVGWQEYIGDSRFWFESFQNWQSEFLAVASIVLLSIWFRQKGSPESKPVDASYAQTGSK
jgi:hypothetical protein